MAALVFSHLTVVWVFFTRTQTKSGPAILLVAPFAFSHVVFHVLPGLEYGCVGIPSLTVLSIYVLPALVAAFAFSHHWLLYLFVTRTWTESGPAIWLRWHSVIPAVLDRWRWFCCFLGYRWVLKLITVPRIIHPQIQIFASFFLHIYTSLLCSWILVICAQLYFGCEIIYAFLTGMAARNRKRWRDNITQWCNCSVGKAVRCAENRDQWKNVVHSTTGFCSPSGIWEKKKKTLKLASFH